MALLQKLLSDRNELMILHQRFVFCSCGAEFEDYTDAENHLVRHSRVEIDAKNGKNDEKRSVILKSLKELVAKLKSIETNRPKEIPKIDQSLLRSIDLPDKVCCLTLEEGELRGGQLREAVCFECAQQVDSFDSLKRHFMDRHAELWEPKCQEGTKNILRKLPDKKDFLPGWSFRYHCSIPGCKYHILTSDAKFFGSRDQIKQHYSKVHAYREFSCDICGTSFPTDVYLKRHKKTSCGKKFACLTCKKSYSATENLKTHCRRKNHLFPPNLSRPSRQIKSTSKPSNDTTPISFINVGGNWLATKVIQPTVKDRSSQIAAFSKDRSSHPVKIAPKPSPMHLTAAIALSELAGDQTATEICGTLVTTASSFSSPTGLVAVTSNCLNSSKTFLSSCIDHNKIQSTNQVQTYLGGCLQPISKMQHSSQVQTFLSSCLQPEVDKSSNSAQVQTYLSSYLGGVDSSKLHNTAQVQTYFSNCLGEVNSGKIRNSAEVQTYLSSCLATVSEQETQTARLVNLSPCYTATNLLSTDKLIWSSSTQTSPRVVGVLRTTNLIDSQESKDDKDPIDNVDQEELLLLSSSDPSSYSDQQMASNSSKMENEKICEMEQFNEEPQHRNRPPKLCEIEQFSTETQTDADFDLIRFRNVKRSGSSDDSPTSDVGDDPMFGSLMSRNQMEAETQFDLDDILCSNYTQTTGEEDDFIIMENDGSASPVTFNSSKTQTVYTGFTTSLDVIYRNQSQHCQTNSLEDLYANPSQRCQTIQVDSSMEEDLYRSHSQRSQTESSADDLDSLYRNPSQRCQTSLLGDSQGELIHMETQTAVEDIFPLGQF